MIWTHGEELLLDFIEYLNSRVPSINFTQEVSQKEVSFLDTKVKIVNNRLETDLYSKPTDSHSYLMYDSAHPQRCKDSIPYGQFLRLRRICSQEIDFQKHVIELTAHFISRGYPLGLLDEAAELAEKKDRNVIIDEALKSKEQNESSDKVLLITQYNPNFQDLRKIVFGNWEMLGKSPTTEFIYERKLMCAYRRPKNLRDLLVKANIPHKEGDERSRPDWQPTPQINSVEANQPDNVTQTPVAGGATLETEPTKPRNIQKSILDFFTPMSTVINLPQTCTVPRDEGATGGKTNQGAVVTEATKCRPNLT